MRRIGLLPFSFVNLLSNIGLRSSLEPLKANDNPLHILTLYYQRTKFTLRKIDSHAQHDYN